MFKIMSNNKSVVGFETGRYHRDSKGKMLPLSRFLKLSNTDGWMFEDKKLAQKYMVDNISTILSIRDDITDNEKRLINNQLNKIIFKEI